MSKKYIRSIGEKLFAFLEKRLYGEIPYAKLEEKVQELEAKNEELETAVENLRDRLSEHEDYR